MSSHFGVGVSRGSGGGWIRVRVTGSRREMVRKCGWKNERACGCVCGGGRRAQTSRNYRPQVARRSLSKNNAAPCNGALVIVLLFLSSTRVPQYSLNYICSLGCCAFICAQLAATECVCE